MHEAWRCRILVACSGRIPGGDRTAIALELPGRGLYTSGSAAMMGPTSMAHTVVGSGAQRAFQAAVPTTDSRRQRRQHAGAVHCRGGAPPQQPMVVQPQAPCSTPSPSVPSTSTSIMMGAVILLQALALAGATVTGVLARKRRVEMEALNAKLRHINAELRRKREEEAADAAVEGDGGPPPPSLEAYRSALERTLGAPAAAHPREGFGEGNLSLASARRRIAATIKAVKEQLREGGAGQGEPPGAGALPLLSEAQGLAEGIGDIKAQRALVRLRARALRKAGDLPAALECLHRSMALSLELGESSGDADVFGEIGDVLTEMGEFERAGQYYDRCIRAIQDEVPQSLSSTWDCQ